MNKNENKKIKNKTTKNKTTTTAKPLQENKGTRRKASTRKRRYKVIKQTVIGTPLFIITTHLQNAVAF